MSEYPKTILRQPMSQVPTEKYGTILMEDPGVIFADYLTVVPLVKAAFVFPPVLRRYAYVPDCSKYLRDNGYIVWACDSRYLPENARVSHDLYVEALLEHMLTHKPYVSYRRNDEGLTK